jgi:hypothetical protein
MEKSAAYRRDSTKPRAMEVRENPLSKGAACRGGPRDGGHSHLGRGNIEDNIVLRRIRRIDDELFALGFAGKHDRAAS